ncbi:MAG TPA: alpha/beta fold hydrolase [Gemmatimonadales bacterium]|nr:alpha/beta fold hydrolase [Gemmatimonadales bacterium]
MASIATRLEPFEIAVANEALEDLSQRLRTTRLSEDDTDDWDAGTSPAYLRELVLYWRDRFDWRAQERALNRFPQFRVEVDGTRLHLIHQRGSGPDRMPLLLTHGFPDSFFRFSKLIPLLADPAAHGGDAADAFDVVVPSLPGYAFSEARTAGGGLFGFGDLWHQLMTEALGYERFGAHGGDWGSTVTEQLGRSHGGSVVGIHLTDVPFWHIFQKPSDPSAAERRYLEHNERWQREEGAYAMIQGTRPRTASPGLLDSPAGLAAWIVEKFRAWSDCGGDVERSYTKDELLTNIMLYWLTGTIGSAFQPYHDVMRAGAVRWTKEKAKEWVGSSKTPAGFAMFPKDISSPPREWAKRFFNVQRWTTMPRGGHFAALEEPAALAEEIRAFFRPLRKG